MIFHLIVFLRKYIYFIPNIANIVQMTKKVKLKVIVPSKEDTRTIINNLSNHQLNPKYDALFSYCVYSETMSIDKLFICVG